MDEKITTFDATRIEAFINTPAAEKIDDLVELSGGRWSKNAMIAYLIEKRIENMDMDDILIPYRPPAS